MTNEELQSQVDKLNEQVKREKLRASIAETTLDTQTRMNCTILESDIKEWPFISVCDKKILAVLYWDRLSEQQQAEFDDRAFKEIEEASKKYRDDIMTDPVKMKQHFLKGAYPILNKILNDASSPKKNAPRPSYETTEVWEVLRGIITSASNPAPLIDLKGKTITLQIDEILTNLTDQKITMDEAKDLMGLVSSGFNLQQLPLLMEKLTAIESQV